MFARKSFVMVLLVSGWLGSAAVRGADVDGDGVPDSIDVCCNTMPGSIVDAEGRPYGDADGDCDVDLADFAIIAINFTGPSSCSPEVCDGIDNDCNCIVDDLGTISCGTGACYNEVPICIAGVMQTCTPLPSSPETCNGIDDNCNGSIDEPFDLLTDPANCGTCGLACSGYPNAAATCQSGACTFDCDPDYADCNVSAVDGCETYLAADPNNCGACNTLCSPQPNATPTCASSSCTLVCNPNYADCNGVYADGCERNLQTDTQNCGACGVVCPQRPHATSFCSGGGCLLVCNSGYVNCNGNVVDGCEINVQTDAQNCGGCGAVCPTGAVCVNATCTIP